MSLGHARTSWITSEIFKILEHDAENRNQILVEKGRIEYSAHKFAASTKPKSHTICKLWVKREILKYTPTMFFHTTVSMMTLPTGAVLILYYKEIGIEWNSSKHQQSLLECLLIVFICKGFAVCFLLFDVCCLLFRYSYSFDHGDLGISRLWRVWV